MPKYNWKKKLAQNKDLPVSAINYMGFVSNMLELPSNASDGDMYLTFDSTSYIYQAETERWYIIGGSDG
jgi:hypothetical protein